MESTQVDCVDMVAKQRDLLQKLTPGRHPHHRTKEGIETGMGKYTHGQGGTDIAALQGKRRTSYEQHEATHRVSVALCWIAPNPHPEALPLRRPTIAPKKPLPVS